MPEETAGLWQTVRRALGRLISGTQIRELPLAKTGVIPPTVGPDALASHAPKAGLAESRWQPMAQDCTVSLPRATAGAGGADLTPAARVRTMPALPRSESAVVRDVDLLQGAGTVHRLDWAEAACWSPAVGTSPVALSAGTAPQSRVRFAPPGAASLPVTGPTLAREPRLRWPGRRIAGMDLLSLAGGRVRSGSEAMTSAPMTRRCCPSPPGLPMSDAFPEERRRLAETVGVPEDDVILLGVFPQVPVAAVRRLAWEESGSLSLWLKPEALAAAAAGKTPLVATLVIGRRRSTGKMIQTVR